MLSTLIATLALAPQAAALEPIPNHLTQQEKAEGFRLLFDGKTTDGWKGWRRQEMPKGWQVRDGSLVILPELKAGGDIATKEQFADFELRLEWKVTPGGNSGIFYRASEEFRLPWATGPEMQVLDNERHPDGKSPLTSAGSNYGMHPAPIDAAKPAGEWNAVRLVAKGKHIEHWLNGKKVVEYEVDSHDWLERYKKSKFAGMPNYARNPSGHIVLQDHGNEVEFRSIKIKPL
ncbi:MAG TPA: DUF1080 domain-containing protein [Fimbriimonadaceae bacterium]|nr:DUF1080 domain-containing protein [Fimbriimonadaceae bacterium]